MAIKIKAQHDYLQTEANIDLPCDLSDLDYLMRTIRGTGKIVALYVEGGLVGVNLEQRSKIRGATADTVRELIGIKTKEINGR